MNIFYGAYGIDVLSIFLIIISGFLNMNRHTSILGFLLLLLVIYRTFSKNVYKRTNELNKFTNYINRILGKFGKSLPYNLPRINLNNFGVLFDTLKYKLNQKTKFKIVTCPNCKQKLRLPRLRKRVIVTCKRCSHEFHVRT